MSTRADFPFQTALVVSMDKSRALAPASTARVLTSKAVEQPHSIRASALVFVDPQSCALRDYLERIGPSDANVLIQGETGTGKELVARHVHDLSHHRRGPFVAVNCAAISETLLDAELFGYRKGAFTGATSDRSGWFESAQGGTLFLDEIGDLPLGAQVKLLLVLQQREVVPVGGRTPIPVDFRLIAATNVELKAAVEAGHFRADLYYRLSVAEVSLRPLRERPGDIPELVAHFLRIYGERLGYREVSLDPSALARLRGYGWPGNIRELENVIHHTLLVCSGNLIRGEDIRLADRPQLGAESPAGPAEKLHQVFADLLTREAPDLYGFSERILIETSYQYCKGNQVRTAAALGISRNVLRERLQRLDIITPSPSRQR